MGIPLNSILRLSEEQIKNSKIELNMNAGSRGNAYIDMWLKRPEAEKQQGLAEGCSYWGWYGNQRNFYPGHWVFSFARLYREDEWLFVSAGKIIDVPKDQRAEVEILKEFEPLFGRMIIKCVKGPTFGRYVFNMGKYLNDATVKEILPALYSGDTFQGYDRVHLPFAKLERIFRGEILPTYRDALECVTGIYCLTDRNTGKLYIGSATGEGGVAQRWGNYLDSKHGGNKKLRDLYNKKGSGYFEANFDFTLLEYYGLSYDSHKILERESYWKECLDTREHGYNDN
ncbi:GIY-YIG nuclease family protein [Slackia piriformis]|nr:GIY-YIG nuclease family protein [Slackia piriformis]